MSKSKRQWNGDKPLRLGSLELPDVDWLALDWKPWPPQGGYCMIIEDPVAEAIASSLSDDRVGPTYLSRVEPGNPIPVHVDTKFATPIRIVVPLMSNPDAWYVMESGRHNLKVGSYYKVNISIPHGAVNGGDCDRIHLVFGVKE